MKILVEHDHKEYEQEVEYREAKLGEKWIDTHGIVYSGGTAFPVHVLRPVKKKINWSLVSGDMLVMLRNNDVVSRRSAFPSLIKMIWPNWNRHDGSGKPPVDPESCIVSVKTKSGRTSDNGVLASNVYWPAVEEFKFVRLKEGYAY